MRKFSTIFQIPKDLPLKAPEEGSTAIHDMQLLVGLIAAQSRIHEAYLYYALQENPNDVSRRMEDSQLRNEEFQAVISGFPSITELRRIMQSSV